ncbi:MAG: polysaccharide deacetylase family protein [Actinobacteria bacterium]|nr:polysaccharide deacetylase family protein [Actinomycetota bacterium]MBE3114626.1 polysaccharide deacetylase family protein [Actinomycetota bacterium]
MNNIMIMYHYIRDKSKFNAFTTKQFNNQLQLIKDKGYRFITIKELIIDNPDDKTCCLTFDDGIKDGFTNALPILQEFDAVATFFIPMRIFIIDEILNIQKRHLLLAKLGEKGFIKEFDYFAGEEYTSKNINEFKYMLDHMDNFILNQIFNRYFNESVEFTKIYLNREDVKELSSCGMEIGTHGFNHCYLGEMSYNKIKEETRLSYGICKNLFQIPFSMSYPMGSYTPLVGKIMKLVGYKAGATTTKLNNISLDTNPFQLNRYDCIDKEIGEL